MNSYDLNAIDVFPDAAWASAKVCGPNGGNCVEVNLGGRGRVGLRDSKSAGGPVIAVDKAGWGRFLAATKIGRLGHE